MQSRSVIYGQIWGKQKQNKHDFIKLVHKVSQVILQRFVFSALWTSTVNEDKLNSEQCYRYDNPSVKSRKTPKSPGTLLTDLVNEKWKIKWQL